MNDDDPGKRACPFGCVDHAMNRFVSTFVGNVLGGRGKCGGHRQQNEYAKQNAFHVLPFTIAIPYIVRPQSDWHDTARSREILNCGTWPQPCASSVRRY